MKTIAFLLSPELRDDGELYVEHGEACFRLINDIKKDFDIVLVVRRIRDKMYKDIPDGVRIVFDETKPDMKKNTNAGTAMQSGIGFWNNCKIPLDKVDCVVAWQGLSPWCIAAAQSMKAERKIIHMGKKPELFFLNEDIPFFKLLYSEFDAVVCSSEYVKDSFLRIIGEVTKIYTAGWSPDISKIMNQKNMFNTNPYETDKLNIVTVHRLIIKTPVENVPFLLSEKKDDFSDVRWYIFGEGARQAHIVHDVVVQDVCDHVIPMKTPENLMEYLKFCDGLVSFDDENWEEKAIARLFDVPVFTFEDDNDSEKLYEWFEKLKKERANRSTDMVWKDFAIWKNLLKGEKDYEN